ncbi:hypothetical protein [Komagataeibacter melomenusus]|nr:hypothetical protein [Komagataeibacter melomenusus]
MIKENVGSSKKDLFWNCIFLFIWSSFSVFNISQHPFWMDEVINLIFGIGADDIYGIHGNGHPAVWFLLLRFLYSIFHKVWVLPLASFAVAFLSVYLFLFKSPFSKKFKLIFLCTNMCMFEYVVMARNYGISMLFMFIIATIYSNEKLKHKLTGPLLFLLCNTNIPSALISTSFVVGNTISSLKKGGISLTNNMRFCIKLSVYNFIGLVVCFLTVFPTFDTAAYLSTENFRKAAVENIGKIFLVSKAFNSISYAPYSDLIPDPKSKIDQINDAYNLPRINGARNLYIDYPECVKEYSSKQKTKNCSLSHKEKIEHLWHNIIKSILTIFTSIIIFMSVFSVYGDLTLFISALISLYVLDVFFVFGYWGMYRHHALWLAFMVSALWISRNSVNTFTEKQIKIRKYGYYCLCILLSMQIFPAFANIFGGYFGYPTSNSYKVANIISKDPTMRDSAIISTNDLNIPALHYYLDNPTFYISQRRFALIFPFSLSAFNFNSLDNVLDDAEKISYCNNTGVIIFLSKNYGRIDDEEIKKPTIFRYQYMDFYVDNKQLSRLYAETTKVASFNRTLLEEGYSIYKLDRSSVKKQYKCTVEYKINRDYFKLNK